MGRRQGIEGGRKGMRRRDAVESGTIKFEFTSGAAGELARRDGRERLRRCGDAGAGTA